MAQRNTRSNVGASRPIQAQASSSGGARGSRQMGPRERDPRQRDSHQRDPRQGDPRQRDPRQRDSRQRDPRQGDSRQRDPRQRDSRQRDSRQRDSQRIRQQESRGAQHPAAGARKQSKGQAGSGQRSKGQWIYPEGYVPPRRSQPPRRRPANQPREKKEQKPAVIIDWGRVGAALLAVALRFVICLVIVASVMGFAFNKAFYSQQQIPYDLVYYTFVTTVGEGDEQKTTTNTYEHQYSSAHSGEQLLISFSRISAWLGSAQVGDVYSMRFIMGNGAESDEDVVFHNGSHNAVVNGTIITMKAPAQFRNGEVWVPLSFITEYVSGIEILQSGGSVTLSLNEAQPSFVLRPSLPLTPAEPPKD